MDIDIVYLWVDGSDPQWRARHDGMKGDVIVTRSEDSEGRYADNDELRYSLRSITQYAPWIRRIHIVTDRQTPAWLDTSDPRIHIVDHSEILPPVSIPCFNSSVLEHCLGRIPGLAEHFLYANDDMFVNRPVTPGDFFTPEGLPIVRLFRKRFRRQWLWVHKHILRKTLPYHNFVTQSTIKLVEDRLGYRCNGKMHHNIDAYRRSDFLETEDMFAGEIAPTMENHFRQSNDVQRCLHSFVPLALGRARPEYVDSRTSFHLELSKPSGYARLEKSSPMLFCLNDSEKTEAAHRRMAREYLSRRFPEPSPFELND